MTVAYARPLKGESDLGDKISTTLNHPLLRRSYTCPSERNVSHQVLVEPPPLRLDAWSEPAAESFQVRGETYLDDKIKVPSEPSLFRLLTVDLINSPEPIFGGLCSHPHERVQQALKRERETGVRELPDFVFCVNLCVPGQSIYHNAFYFGIDKAGLEEIKQGSTPSGRLLKRFLFGDSDDFRNKTFKLIPRIVEGTYIVRKSVGSKPSILGKKIKQYYIRTDRFMEVIVDIASDSFAQRIVKLCLGYLKTIVVDMMFVLEGNDVATLPERILGGVRLTNIDFKELDGKRVVAAI
jgi:Protein ENHANCED DISEASE RESISTANCE 2, C-terminal